MNAKEENHKDKINSEPFSDKMIDEIFSVEQSLGKPIGQNDQSQEDSNQKNVPNKELEEIMISKIELN